MPKTLQRWVADLARLARTDRWGARARSIQHILGRRLTSPKQPTSPVQAPDESARHAAPIAPVARTPIPASTEGVTLSGQHSAAGLTRSYLLYLPPTDPKVSPPSSWPLVVMLHGCTQDPADFALGTGMNHLAREHGFAVLYPAQSEEAHPQRCWNWYRRDHQQRGRGEAEVLADMTRTMVNAYGLDTRRVYVAGMSAGGAMAAILGQAYPELYAAVGIHSGLAGGAASNLITALAIMKMGPRTVTSTPRTSHQHDRQGVSGTSPNIAWPSARPTIVFHGDSDSVVHPSNGAQAINAALAPYQGTAVQTSVEEGVSSGGRPYTRTTYACGEDTNCQAEHWVVHGSGHAWSGGQTAGSYTDPSGPDASHAMWEFFRCHVQPAARQGGAQLQQPSTVGRGLSK